MEAEKLKFTKITSDSLYHFKYDEVDYVIFNGRDEEYYYSTILYRGRCKGKLEHLRSAWSGEWSIKYKHNKRTLSSIDKEYFIEQLPDRIKELLK